MRTGGSPAPSSRRERTVRAAQVAARQAVRELLDRDPATERPGGLHVRRIDRDARSGVQRRLLDLRHERGEVGRRPLEEQLDGRRRGRPVRAREPGARPTRAALRGSVTRGKRERAARRSKADSKRRRASSSRATRIRQAGGSTRPAAARTSSSSVPDSASARRTTSTCAPPNRSGDERSSSAAASRAASSSRPQRARRRRVACRSRRSASRALEEKVSCRAAGRTRAAARAPAPPAGRRPRACGARGGALRSPPRCRGRRRGRPGSTSSSTAVAPARLADLHVRQVDEVARVDRLVLEARRRRHHRAGDRAEVGALLERRVLIQHAAGRALGELQRDEQVALELRRLVGALNATGLLQNRMICPLSTRSPSWSVTTSSVPRRRNSSSIALCSATSRPFSRECSRTARSRWCARSRARSCRFRRGGSRSRRRASRRRARRRTATRASYDEAHHATRERGRACAPAARRAAPAPARRRARPRARRQPSRPPPRSPAPAPCRSPAPPARPSSRASAAASATGHAASRRARSSRPTTSHSSLATCGTNGASSSRIVVRPPRAASAGCAVSPARVGVAVTSSITAAIAGVEVLALDRRPRSRARSSGG